MAGRGGRKAYSRILRRFIPPSRLYKAHPPPGGRGRAGKRDAVYFCAFRRGRENKDYGMDIWDCRDGCGNIFFRIYGVFYYPPGRLRWMRARRRM